MPIILKPISPKKLNISGLRAEIEKQAKPYADGVKRDFESTFSTWSQDSKPKLNVKTNINLNGAVSIEVDVVGEIYTFVHEGTKPHEIKAKNAKRLRFTSNYNAKTVIGQIKSQSGGASGEILYRQRVFHPGFKGRNFSKLIMTKWRQPFFKAMQRALDNWAKKQR